MKEKRDEKMRNLIVGSRNSKLALVQTNWVLQALKDKGVEHPFHIKEIMTSGDQQVNVPLAQLGSGGVFLRELEAQLLNGTLDFAVHSLKDMPTSLPDGLTIACIPEREDHRDAYLANDHIPFHELAPGAVIGTSSLRRAAQLLAKRSDIETKWIRGPIDSRIKQLQAGHFDAIILAVAGLKRLKMNSDLVTEYLPDHHFIPAMGQGALAIECREDDQEMKDLLSLIHDENSARAVQTERLFLDAFDDGEQAPIGGYASVRDDQIHLRGMVISTDGQTLLRHEATGTDPVKVANEVANVLIQQGALKIIAASNAELIQK